MTNKTLVVAIVGHTNSGKTSFMQTILRKKIGEARDEAGTTQEVRRNFWLQEIEIVDTPGFQEIDYVMQELGVDCTNEDIEKLLKKRINANAPQAQALGKKSTAEQELDTWKAINSSDAVFYIVDCEQSLLRKETKEVRLKFSNEWRFIKKTKKPIIPVLNKTEHGHKHVKDYRDFFAEQNSEQLVVDLDAWYFDPKQEDRLLDKLLHVFERDTDDDHIFQKRVKGAKNSLSRVAEDKFQELLANHVVNHVSNNLVSVYLSKDDREKLKESPSENFSDNAKSKKVIDRFFKNIESAEKNLKDDVRKCNPRIYEKFNVELGDTFRLSELDGRLDIDDTKGWLKTIVPLDVPVCVHIKAKDSYKRFLTLRAIDIVMAFYVRGFALQVERPNTGIEDDAYDDAYSKQLDRMKDLLSKLLEFKSDKKARQFLKEKWEEIVKLYIECDRHKISRR